MSILPTKNIGVTDNFYFLSVNGIALALYKKSLCALMDSECVDYMVHRMDRHNVSEVMSEIKDYEHFMLIDERNYTALYGNLCKKLKMLYDVNVNG